MGLKLDTMCVVLDSGNPEELSAFYEKLLGWKREAYKPGDEWIVVSSGRRDGYPELIFQRTEDYRAPVWPEKPGEPQQMMHLDFHVEDVSEGVEHALACGARLSPVQLEERWRVMLDPAGHPFCVLPRREVEEESHILDIYKLYIEKRLEHILRVHQLCFMFARKMNGINFSLLNDAILLHDLAKECKGLEDKDEYHHERKYLVYALREKKIDIECINEFDDICIIVENHKGLFYPHKHVWESAILRICDKLDKFNKGMIKANIKYDKVEDKVINKGKSCEKAARKAKEKASEVADRKREKALESCENTIREIECFFENDSSARQQMMIFHKIYDSIIKPMIGSYDY